MLYRLLLSQSNQKNTKVRGVTLVCVEDLVVPVFVGLSVLGVCISVFFVCTESHVQVPGVQGSGMSVCTIGRFGVGPFCTLFIYWMARPWFVSPVSRR